VLDRALRYVTTVTIEGGVARVVVLRGREVITWGTIYLPKEVLEEAGADGHGDGIPPARLRAFLDRFNLVRGRLVTDLPLHAPLARRIQLAKIKGKTYLPDVVLSEVLETVPFSAAEADVKWVHRKREGGGYDVYGTAVRKSPVDRRVRLLKDAGKQPLAAYAQGAALAFAVGMDDGVIVRLDSGRAVVVFIKGKVPEVIQETVLPPGSELTVLERAELIAQAIEQAAGYDEDASLRKTESEALPVVLTGPGARDLLMVWAVHELVKRPILPFAPKLSYPDHFDAYEYVVNIGLALADQAGKRRRRQPKAQAWTVVANLLSERHLPRPFPMAPTAVFVALFLFASAAYNVTPRVAAVESRAATLGSRLESLEGRERQARLEQAQEGKTEEQIAAAVNLVTGLEEFLAQREADTLMLRDRVDAIVRGALPSGVQVANAALRGDAFVLEGVGESYESVLAYTQALRTTGLFLDAEVLRMGGAGEGMSEAGPSGVSFQAMAYVSPPTTEEGDESSLSAEDVEGLKAVLTLLESLVQAQQ
jgi:hypothetical protein